MNRILSILGGLLTAACPFLPFGSMLGVSVTMLQFESDRMGIVYFIIGTGVLMMIVGLVNKRYLNIVNILLALMIGGMGALLYSGCTERGMTPGFGVWALILGGLITLVGAIMGVAVKKKAAAANA